MAVNKLDMVDFDQDRYNFIVAELTRCSPSIFTATTTLQSLQYCTVQPLHLIDQHRYNFIVAELTRSGHGELRHDQHRAVDRSGMGRSPACPARHG